MLKTLFKFLFYLLIAVLIAGGIIGAFLMMGRDIQEALFFFGLILSVCLVFIVARKISIRIRARSQVKRVLQEETPFSETEGGRSAKGSVRDLKRNWRTAIRALKRSQLKMQGDPLYVLPWYMIFGRPGSGKSTALRSAKLLSPEINFPDHIDGSTENLEWWLYEQAIVIDTAGRYAVPDDKEDREEWRTLLSMLSRHKQKEPLSGVVLVIAADRLLDNSDEALMEEGRQVRASISDLMNQLEAKPPVYLMVTKCDLIKGFTGWCEYLPEEAMLQPMGHLNEQEDGSFEKIIDRSLDKVLDRMKELRLLMLERSHNPNDSLLELPTEMEKIRSRIQIFITTALKENVYQETPQFRGLYFSSSVHLSSGPQTSKEERKGVFLHQFFTRILPSERGLIDSLTAAVRARRALHAYVLSGMGIVTFVALLVLSGLFARDMSRLDEVNRTHQQINLQQVGINQQFQTLNRLRGLILDLDAAQEGWIFPWLGSFARPAQLTRLIQKYNQNFSDQILLTFDKPLTKRITTLESDETILFAGGLVRRVNHLSECIDGGGCGSFENLPPISEAYVLKANNEVNKESAALFNDLYRSYLSWNTAPVLLEEEMRHLRVRLLQLLENNKNDFQWMVEWSNRQSGVPVHISDFWGGSRVLKDPPMVPAAYTLQGRAFILNFWEELAAAYNKGEAVRVRAMKSDFDDYYERRYIKSWVQFVSRFDEGHQRLRNRKEWLSSLERMASEGNPYFNLMERVSTEMAPINMVDGFPSRTYFNLFDEMQVTPLPGDGLSAGSLSIKQGQHFFEKAGKAAQALVQAVKTGKKAEQKIKRLNGESRDRFDDKLEDAAKTLHEYKKALSETAFHAETRTQSASTISKLFDRSNPSGTGDGPAASAESAVVNLQKLIGKPNDDSSLFWEIYGGPLRVAYHFMKKETDCYLQEKWEEKVLAEIEGVPKNKMVNVLIKEDVGLVWKYVNGDAKPFLNKSFGKQYRSAFVNGEAIEWTDAYKKYINQAEGAKKLVGEKFNVELGALPTGVNMSAKVAPYSAILELHCAEGTQTLANFNFYVRAIFEWSMETCGDVTLHIEIGELTLSKEYKDETGKGFSMFLKEFRDGRHVFVAEDFPEFKEQLDEKNVAAIDVSYEISGQDPVIKILEEVPVVLPIEVTSCWS